jgi:predicted kinase
MIDKITPSPRPRLICIGGLPGTGKTTLGLGLQARLGADTVLVCPDRTMLRLLGKPESGVIESRDITPDLVKAAIADMRTRTRTALATGQDVIVPSAFVGQAMRADFKAIATDTGADFRPFWLHAPIAVLHERARIRAFNKAAGNASAVGPDKIKTSLIEGKVDWPHINATQSPSVLLQKILEDLNKAPAPKTFSLKP